MVAAFRALSQLLEGQSAASSDPFELTELYQRLYFHHIPFDPEALLRSWQGCGPPRHDSQECARGLERARALVERGVTTES